MARRIWTIVEIVSAKEKHLRELKQIMLQQNFPLSVIDHGITKAKQIPQAELRRPKDRGDNGKILPFVTTFNPNNPSVYAIIKSTFESLQENEINGMRDFKLIHSRRHIKKHTNKR